MVWPRGGYLISHRLDFQDRAARDMKLYKLLRIALCLSKI